MKPSDWSKAVQHFVMFTSGHIRLKMLYKMNPKNQSSEY